MRASTALRGVGLVALALILFVVVRHRGAPVAPGEMEEPLANDPMMEGR